jgi:hypothetical protein
MTFTAVVVYFDQLRNTQHTQHAVLGLVMGSSEASVQHEIVSLVNRVPKSLTE